MILFKKILLFCLLISLSACSRKVYQGNYQGKSQIATMRPYKVYGKTYYPRKVNVGYTEKGKASWYGPGFHGKKTSNGEIYDQHSFTAAHTNFPMNTIVKVTNLENNKIVVVRINDRGPFAKNRIIDLSNAAAKELDMTQKGTADVQLEVLQVDAIHALNKDNLYLVQIASFEDYPKALKYKIDEDNKYGYSSTIKESSSSFRVYLEGFPNEESARAFVNKGYYKNALVIIEKG